MKQLVHAFVIRRLDYCTASILASLPKGLLSQLQRIQNAAAGLVLGRDGKEPSLFGFGSVRVLWLPVFGFGSSSRERLDRLSLWNTKWRFPSTADGNENHIAQKQRLWLPSTNNMYCHFIQPRGCNMNKIRLINHKISILKHVSITTSFSKYGSKLAAVRRHCMSP